MSRARLTLALLLAACSSERAEPQPVAPHPAVAAAARCRDCHAAPGDAPGDAPPAPVWHVLDCCGPDFADCRPCHTTEAFRPALFDHAAWPLDGAHRVPDPDAPLRCDRCHAVALPADDAAPPGADADAPRTDAAPPGGANSYIRIQDNAPEGTLQIGNSSGADIDAVRWSCVGAPLAGRRCTRPSSASAPGRPPPSPRLLSVARPRASTCRTTTC